MSTFEDVLSQLRDLEDFTQRHAVKPWVEKLRGIRERSGNPQELTRQVLNVYVGSMGSLTDVAISRFNGDEVDDEAVANADLTRMVHELYERAKALYVARGHLGTSYRSATMARSESTSVSLCLCGP